MLSAPHIAGSVPVIEFIADRGFCEEDDSVEQRLVNRDGVENGLWELNPPTLLNDVGVASATMVDVDHRTVGGRVLVRAHPKTRPRECCRRTKYPQVTQLAGA